MNKISQTRIIGMDVSRDWLDIHCLPDGQGSRLPNTDDGHARLAERARSMDVLVCFEATGGQEWRLWAPLDAAGAATRKLPPARIKAFAASRGTRAKTDRIGRCPTVHRLAMSREGPNALRASWHSAPMPAAACRMKNCAISER